jgi:competence protein ComGF
MFLAKANYLYIQWVDGSLTLGFILFLIADAIVFTILLFIKFGHKKLTEETIDYQISVDFITEERDKVKEAFDQTKNSLNEFKEDLTQNAMNVPKVR